MPMKERVDRLLVSRGLASSREKAQALIMAGLVFSGTERIAKPGRMMDDAAALTLKDTLPFVGRGGQLLRRRVLADDDAGRTIVKGCAGKVKIDTDDNIAHPIQERRHQGPRQDIDPTDGSLW